MTQLPPDEMTLDLLWGLFNIDPSWKQRPPLEVVAEVHRRWPADAHQSTIGNPNSHIAAVSNVNYAVRNHADYGHLVTRR